MEDLTIIYYTSNREKPDFEKKIRDNILEVSGGLPIISVSQKPIDFGMNVCVGDVGVSGFNMFRQVQIGCELAKTKFVVSCEADCLYPPDYFQFVPEHEDICYRTSNLYVMGDRRNYYFHKAEGATHAQIVGTKFYLETLNRLFESASTWKEGEKNFPKERHGKEDIFAESKIERFESKNPVVQIKTHDGMRYYTRSSRTPIYSIPYWGDGKIIKERYCGSV